MILIDGKKIAEDILESIKRQVTQLGFVPTLTVIACDPNFETEKYLALKKRKAEALGISLSVQILSKNAETKDVVEAVVKASTLTHGVVVQLPLPKHVDTDAVLAAVPSTHDVDAFRYQEGVDMVFPPVIGAIDEISTIHNVEWEAKKVVVFGAGRLVGIPAKQYAANRGAEVFVVTEETEYVETYTKDADIIILGVGKQNLLTPEMVKAGVVVFDAGASEDGGLLVGDADPLVAAKAALFTPVPGGIGPITVALLFRNLLQLLSK